jgi:NOL1/NOP2/fmu family ribosome biogenesis protein
VKPKKNEGSENACPVRNAEGVVASRNGIKLGKTEKKMKEKTWGRYS